MLGLIDLLTAALPLLYGLTSVNYTVYFLRRDPFAERTCTSFLAGTVAIHVGFVVLLSTYFGRVPVATLLEALNLMALSVAITYLYVERTINTEARHLFCLWSCWFNLRHPLLPNSNPAVAPQSHLFQSSLFGLHAIAAILGTPPFWLDGLWAYVLCSPFVETEELGLIFERLLAGCDEQNGLVTFLGWIFRRLRFLVWA